VKEKKRWKKENGRTELGKKDEERGNGGSERRKDKGFEGKREGNVGVWEMWKKRGS